MTFKTFINCILGRHNFRFPLRRHEHIISLEWSTIEDTEVKCSVCKVKYDKVMERRKKRILDRWKRL